MLETSKFKNKTKKNLKKLNVLLGNPLRWSFWDQLALIGIKTNAFTKLKNTKRREKSDKRP